MGSNVGPVNGLAASMTLPLSHLLITATWPAGRRRALKQPADRLAAIAPRATELVPQFALGPRWQAPRIPLADRCEGLVVGQGKAPCKPTARLECAQIAVLTTDRWRNRLQIPACSVEAVSSSSDVGTASTDGRRSLAQNRRRKVRRREEALNVAILHGDQMGCCPLVAEEARHSRR